MFGKYSLKTSLSVQLGPHEKIEDSFPSLLTVLKKAVLRMEQPARISNCSAEHSVRVIL